MENLVSVVLFSSKDKKHHIIYLNNDLESIISCFGQSLDFDSSKLTQSKIQQIVILMNADSDLSLYQIEKIACSNLKSFKFNIMYPFSFSLF